MSFKSGEGVVYLTRPQKSFLSSQPPDKPKIHHLRRIFRQKNNRWMELIPPNMASFPEKKLQQNEKKTWHLRPKLLQ